MPNEFVIKNGFFSQGNSNVTGSFIAGPSGTPELQVGTTGLIIGNVSTDVHRATGSFFTTGSMALTGSFAISANLTASNIRATLQGTASWASNAISYAHISGAASGRLLLSDGTTGFITASSNLLYVGTTFSVTGSTIMSASSGLTPLTVQGSGSTPIFRVQGSTGTLFSVTDVTAGSLFSVTNASAIPIFDVQSTMTSSFSGSVLIHVTGSNETSASLRPLTISHASTATPTTDFGVGIDFRNEDASGVANVRVGTLDYEWDRAESGGTWGKAEISLSTSGSVSGSKMILPFAENSFGGNSRYTAIHTKVGDTAGKYPNYRVYMYRETTAGTFSPMIYADSAFSVALPLANDTTWMYTAYIVARRTDADDESAAYWVQGAIDNNANVIALVGAPTITAVEDTAAWNVNVITTGGTGLTFTVQGEAAKTIRWNGYVDIVQVSG